MIVREYKADKLCQEVLLGPSVAAVIKVDNSSNVQRAPIAPHLALKAFASLLLPAGYPNTVTPDYLEFQLWDTIQAACSYLRGILCTQAVLVGVGVGDASATATSATVQWVLRDGLGMFGGMLFAWSVSNSFGLNVKQWRFFADCINDVGLTLDLLSPLFPRHFLLMVTVGSICRAMCGVAAGSTRPAISLHFARSNNLADISAKESIQETLVTLIGLVTGLLCAKLLGRYGAAATWAVFLLLTAVHVVANYWGMLALVLDTINYQRGLILCHHHIQRGAVLGPRDVAKLERLLWFGDASIHLGAVFGDTIRSQEDLDRARAMGDPLDRFLISRKGKPSKTPRVEVVLHRDATPRDTLRALYHAVSTQWSDEASIQAKDVVTKCKSFESGLQTAGWDLSRINLSESVWRADWTKSS